MKYLNECISWAYSLNRVIWQITTYWDFFYFLRLQARWVAEAAVFLEEIPRNIVLTFWSDSDSLKCSLRSMNLTFLRPDLGYLAIEQMDLRASQWLRTQDSKKTFSRYKTPSLAPGSPSPSTWWSGPCPRPQGWMGLGGQLKVTATGRPHCFGNQVVGAQ